MFFQAKLKYLRIAPRKVRLVADLIRGKSVEEAQRILNFTVNKSSFPLLKLLKSAIANAKNQFQSEESNLYISKILVDEGSKFKRWMPRARGQASEIQKKTSHITIVLDEIKKKPLKEKKISLSKTETKKIKKTVESVKKEVEKISETEKTQEERKPSLATTKPRLEKEKIRPKFEKGLRRIFRRKSF